MTNDTDRLVKKLWSYCNVLRDDGLSYQDYLEQLTFLLFLKMADERVAMMGGEHPVPKGYRWSNLSKPDMEGARLDEHYRKTLRHLGQQKGMLGLIFGKAQPIQCLIDFFFGPGNKTAAVGIFDAHNELPAVFFS